MTQIEDRVRSGLRAEAEAVARVGTTAESTSDRPSISLSGSGVDSRRQTRRWGRMVPGWAYGTATMVVVLVLILGLALLLPGGNENDVVEPTPTTVAPEPETMSDLDVIEAGVAALYSGDAEQAVELFELPFMTDVQIRSEAVWQAAIGGRLTMNCTEQATPGWFTCHAPYHNAITDAINYHDGGDAFGVLVRDGVIKEFSFPEHSGLMVPLAAFLSQVEGNQACEQKELFVLPRTADCANFILEHLDEWAPQWQQYRQPGGSG